MYILNFQAQTGYTLDMNISTTTDIFLNWILASGLPALLFLFAGILLYYGVQRPIKSLVNRIIHPTKLNQMTVEDATKRRNTIISLLTTLTRVVIVIAVIIIVFRFLFPGVDLTPLLASAGIVGIALGFGAQSLVKDVISGIFIMSENQYRVGDTVEIQGASGNVERVSMRTTTIRDVEGNVHFIPNGSITQVTNKTMGFSAVNFTIVIEPDSDIDKVSKLINSIGEELAKAKSWKEKVIEPPRFVNIGAFTDIYLEIIINGKTQPAAQWDVTGEMRRRLLKAFEENGIKLAHQPVAAMGKR